MAIVENHQHNFTGTPMLVLNFHRLIMLVVKEVHILVVKKERDKWEEVGVEGGGSRLV